MRLTFHPGRNRSNCRITTRFESWRYQQPKKIPRLNPRSRSMTYCLRQLRISFAKKFHLIDTVPRTSSAPSRTPSARGILSTSLLACFHHFADVRRWTDLDESTPQPQPWTLGNELNCVVQILRFKHLNSTQLLLRFRVRTVCDYNPSVLPRYGDASNLARRRRVSTALNRAVKISHGRGLPGTPLVGHALSAAAKASCIASSARSKSPSKRIRVAKIRPESTR
jgi:hypothetical protein